MDGKSRWTDNIMIERWFRTFKYEEAYLTEWKNIKEARQAIATYIHKYNFERCHYIVEGTNSKLKMIKRTMYGRCSRKLLEAKLMCNLNVS